MSIISRNQSVPEPKLPDWLWMSWLYLLPVLSRKFRWQYGYLPTPLRPRSFNEKILHRMVFDRRAELIRFAGKLESREVVLERTNNPSLLPQIFAVARTVEDVAQLSLPPRFVMKGNHGSGMVRFVDGHQPIDISDISQTVADWLAIDYGRDHLEWCYRGVERAVIFEEILDAPEGAPSDYKFFCFDGQARFIQFSSARFTGHTITILDREWRALPITIGHYPRHDTQPAAPTRLADMIEIAETLSARTDFVRVDLYQIGESIKFGELTNYPFGAWGKIEPASWDLEIGRHWKMPSLRRLRP